ETALRLDQGAEARCEDERRRPRRRRPVCRTGNRRQSPLELSPRTLIIALLLAMSAAALYTTRLSTAPQYLARDEVISGDLAQSIVTTGRDLDGNRYPLFLGEPTYHPGRDPLLIYATALLLKFMPLSEFAVRLPNALV